MYLSNRLTFSLFSVLLVAFFAFGTIPAMAQTTVTVSARYTPDDDATTGVDEEKLVVTFTYNKDAWPEPVAADFTVNGAELTDSQTFEGVDKKTYTVTIAGEDDITGLTLRGWQAVDVTTTVGSPTTYTITPAGGIASSPAADATALLVVAADHLAPDGYLIIANNATAIDADADPPIYPTLPETSNIIKRAWFQHDGDDNTTDATGAGRMPDLYDLFRVNGGGTINLRVNIPGTANRLGSLKGDALTPDPNHNRNQRHVVINEVMWAYDNNYVGEAGRTQEQWIELLNRSTMPIAYTSIVLTTKKNPANMPADVNAKAETDRLSTYASFTNAWTAAQFEAKGQHGDSDDAAEGDAIVEFISMHRTNHGDGSNQGHWAAAGELFLRNYKGTPGRANSSGGIPGARSKPGTDIPAKGTFVINEIGNMSNDVHDWIEIKNITGSPQSLKNWALSIVTAFDNERELYRFPEKSPSGTPIMIPAGGVFLLVNEDPKTEGNKLARGFNLNVDAVDQDFGIDKNISYLIVPNKKIAIPANNDWLLILRNNNPWNVKDGRNVYNTGFRVQDVAGAARIVKQDLNKPDPAQEKKADGAGGGDIWHTTHFPLNGHNLGGDKILRHDRNLSMNVWARNTGKQGYERHAFNPASFTGIGYDRNVANNAANGGTPGYDNGIAKGKVADISGGALVISELMLATDNGRYPQWVELQNTSKTHGIHLAADATDPKHGWQIIIENYNSGTWKSENRPLHVTFNLKEWFSYIPPNQSVLIAAFEGSSSVNIPANRIANVTRTNNNPFKMAGRRDSFLNAEDGFYIKIIDGDGNVSDEIGNLDGIKENVRDGIGIDEPKGFSWPTSMTEDDERTSLIRLKNGVKRGGDGVMGTPGTARVGVPGMQTDEEGNPITDANGDPMYDMKGSVAPMGSVPGTLMDKEYAWIHASDLDFVDVPRGHQTWFGTSSDIGTPLHIAGTPLPVELSFFRPTLENGQVTIQWTTESELDNAGFNILRSDTRNGEFTQVNEQMIQGKGTTAERSTYKWVDTTAKPDAVYYYQIEDVSFAGEHNTLATTKLKGLISAKGKLTTSWGDIKDASQ